MCINIILLIKFLLIRVFLAEDHQQVWRWTCENKKCVRIAVLNEPFHSHPLTLEQCKAFCNEYGFLWPLPTGKVNLGHYLTPIDIDARTMTFRIMNRGRANHLVKAALKRFRRIVQLMVPADASVQFVRVLDVTINIQQPQVDKLVLGTNESYSLTVRSVDKNQSKLVEAIVTGNTFFGIRHGLETLAQLMLYDEVMNCVWIIRDVTITDQPKYPYRGIMLDTSRQYYSPDSIKALIDAMALVKLNTFHWHITDSPSFPFVSKRRPLLSKYGAYGPKKDYSINTIHSIVEYALARGVRIIPELDVPAHVGAGWEHTNLTLCQELKPWPQYCLQPPCGQLNPAANEVYDVLQDLYADINDAFFPEMVHMGGDDVNERCWNTSKQIRTFLSSKGWANTSRQFIQLFDHFQKQAQQRVYKAMDMKVPLIVWPSVLSQPSNIQDYLDKNEYIIQSWYGEDDRTVQSLLEKGYRVIISNHDSMFMDCNDAGHFKCVYVSWQKVYENNIGKLSMNFQNLVLGGEAVVWSEQIDENTLEGRLWPRAAALAERLWSDPEMSWQKAEPRMLFMRERLVRMNVRAEALVPRWCYHNEGRCNA